MQAETLRRKIIALLTQNISTYEFEMFHSTVTGRHDNYIDLHVMRKDHWGYAAYLDCRIRIAERPLPSSHGTRLRHRSFPDFEIGVHAADADEVLDLIALRLDLPLVDRKNITMKPKGIWHLKSRIERKIYAEKNWFCDVAARRSNG